MILRSKRRAMHQQHTILSSKYVHCFVFCHTLWNRYKEIESAVGAHCAQWLKHRPQSISHTLQGMQMLTEPIILQHAIVVFVSGEQAVVPQLLGEDGRMRWHRVLDLLTTVRKRTTKGLLHTFLRLSVNIFGKTA